MLVTVIAGVAWSYVLDGAMALLYHLPGMAMPFC
jgi:hypothetical protein